MEFEAESLSNTSSAEEAFKARCDIEIQNMRRDSDLRKQSLDWLIAVSKYNYSYHFEWLGRPIIQFPTDVMAIQEIIWNNRPDLIIETGIAHGGSLLLSSSMLALLDLMDQENGCENSKRRKVIGIDIDIKRHNRLAIESHAFASRIQLLEGSSIEMETIKEVGRQAQDYQKIMVILDSNHSHQHVLQELLAYSEFVSVNQYLVVLDTIVEYFPIGSFPNRNWDKGNNPFTAVKEFLTLRDDFYPDINIDDKLLISVAPNGFLRRSRLKPS